MIKAILACDESGGVGLNGKMPLTHSLISNGLWIKQKDM